MEARAGDSRAEIANPVAHAAPALTESARPDLSDPHPFLACAPAQIQACAAWARHDCFCSQARSSRAIAKATQHASAASLADDRSATIWIVRASPAARSLRPIRAPARAPCQAADAGNAA